MTKIQKVKLDTKSLSSLVIFGLSSIYSFQANGYNDWKAISTCQKYERKCLCKGYYVPEISPGQILSEQLTVSGDAGEVEVHKSAIITGKAKAEQNQTRLTADKIKIHFAKNNSDRIEKLEAFNKVVISTPFERIQGNYAKSLIAEDKKLISNPTYSLYKTHGHGKAKELTTTGNHLLSLKDATYTSCAPNNQTWFLKSDALEINKQTGRGQSWHTKLYVKNVPIFYWPYVNFPIDDRRKTGFLTLEIESNNTLGKMIGLPFYWNIAPNFDATITPYWSSKSTGRIYSQFRYLQSNYQGTIEIDWLPHDRAYREFRRKKIENPGSVSTSSLQMQRLKDTYHRYAFNIQQVGSVWENTKYGIYYVNVGDNNYIDNIGNKILHNNFEKNSLLPKSHNDQQMPQSFRSVTKGKYGTTKFNISSYQTLYAFNAPTPTLPYRQLPYLAHSFPNYQYKRNFNFKSSFDYTKFTKRHDPQIVRSTEGHRIHGSFGFAAPIKYHPGWFVKPEIDVDAMQQYLSRSPSESMLPTKPGRVIPSYSLTTGLFFDRNIKINSQEYTQTLEPKVMYLYTPEINQDDFPNFQSGQNTYNFDQVFRKNRYSGYDRITPTNQISLGLTSKFINDEGEDKAIFNIGIIRYIGGIKLLTGETAPSNNKYTPIAAQGRYNVNQHWSLISNWTYDSYLNNTKLFDLTLQCKPLDYNVFNLHYIYQSPTTKQLGASFSVMPRHNMRMYNYTHYDISQKRLTKFGVGLDIFNCCVAVKATFEQDRKVLTVGTGPTKKYNNKFGLQISFVGFTDIALKSAAEFDIPGQQTPKFYQ